MDYCYEICGDGYDYRYYDCDDGNIISGDGCDSACRIELGFHCDFGTFDGNPARPWYTAAPVYYSDICWEICGDGLDFHWYECDDGNLVNGDGCNDKCEIEPGWDCIYGTWDWRDVCYHWNNNPAIVGLDIFNNSVMYVYFNTSIQLVGGWTPLDTYITLNFTGPRTIPHYYEFHTYSLTNKADVTSPYG